MGWAREEAGLLASRVGVPVGSPPCVHLSDPAPAHLSDASPGPGGLLAANSPFGPCFCAPCPHKPDLVRTGERLLSGGPSRGECPPRPVPLTGTFSLSSVWGRPLGPAMPKRKVTFQGVGNEDEEDEISVPKKKVRRPDSYVLGRSEGEEKGAGSQKRGNVWGRRKGQAFHVLREMGLEDFQVESRS